MSVDYSSRAIEARLRQATDGVDLRPERRLDHKIDYSPAAVKRRLEAVEQARRACVVLAEAGEGLT